MAKTEKKAPEWFDVYYFIRDYEQFRAAIKEQKCEAPAWFSDYLEADQGDFGGIILSYITALNEEYKSIAGSWPQMPGILTAAEQSELAEKLKKIKYFYSKKDDFTFDVGRYVYDRDGYLEGFFSPDNSREWIEQHMNSLAFRLSDMIKRLPEFYNDLERLYLERAQKAENQNRLQKWVEKQNKSEGAAFVQSFLGNIDKYKSAIKANI